MDRARPLPEARLPWRSPKARRPPTERFLIYTLQRHEHVQRGFGPSVPRLRWSFRPFALYPEHPVLCSMRHEIELGAGPEILGKYGGCNVDKVRAVGARSSLLKLGLFLFSYVIIGISAYAHEALDQGIENETESIHIYIS